MEEQLRRWQNTLMTQKPLPGYSKHIGFLLGQ
jgi:hypothetical protein